MTAEARARPTAGLVPRIAYAAMRHVLAALLMIPAAPANLSSLDRT